MGLDIKADPKVFGEGDVSGKKLEQAVSTALLTISNKYRDTLKEKETTSELANERIPDNAKN